MPRFEYGSESPFWYFLAHRAVDETNRTLPAVLDNLNKRSKVLGLPIVYKIPHALAWAVACQLYNVTQPKSDAFGKMGFGVMLSAFDRVLAPKGFARICFERVLGNIAAPAFPGRSREDSVADTFLANGKTVGEEVMDSQWPTILEACLSDDIMLSLGRDACHPSADLWDSTITEYSRRRPGGFRRMFTDPNKWLFD